MFSIHLCQNLCVCLPAPHFKLHASSIPQALIGQRAKQYSLYWNIRWSQQNMSLSVPKHWIRHT